MPHQRLFDHEEAATRNAAGESLRDLAAEYGVTYEGVRQAIRMLDPDLRRRHNDWHREYQRRVKRTNCLRCGALIWKDSCKVKIRTGLCHRCVSDDHATTVREDTLECGACHHWKPDRDFPRSADKIARRGRHSVCRGCQAAVRRDYRRRNMIPCADCGKPTSPAGKEGRRTPPDTPPRCQGCSRRARL